MPLVLGGVETARPQTIVWDNVIPAEVVEAQQRISELKTQGFVLRTMEEGEAVLDPPPKDPNIGVFRILSDKGDERLVWDRRSGPEVKDAYKKFGELLKKGYTAYAVDMAGDRGHKITEFDPALEEIILVPGTVPG